MKPDTITRELASDLAPSNVTGSATFAAQQIIAGKDSQTAFKPEFITRCALLTTDECWDVRLLLARAFPKDGFGPRGEFVRRVKAAQIDLEPPERRAGWTAGLLLNDNGAAKPVLANAILALQLAPDWSGVLGYDEFAKQLRIRKATPWGRTTGEWSDDDDSHLSVWLQQSGILVGSNIAHEAASMAGHQNSYHPVREYLDGLGEPSDEKLLDQWLMKYLGCQPAGSEQQRYIEAVGRCWLISAVARIYQPGCKADCCLTIEGKTGVGKSTSLQALGEPWFTDSQMILGNHDFYQNIQGVWIVEIADLAAYNRLEIEQVKSVLSSPKDRFRWSYARNPVDYPRQCVFACTTEADDWSKETSARRFWPVLATSVDLAELKAARGQLWAEAVVAYRSGQPWYLDHTDLVLSSQSEQASRHQAHPWTKKIGEFISQLEFTTTEDILSMAIIKPLERQNKADQMTAASCLRSLGWSVRRTRDEDRGGRQIRRWYPPESD